MKKSIKWLPVVVTVVVIVFIGILLGKPKPENWVPKNVSDLNVTIQYPSDWSFQIKHSDGDKEKEADKSRVNPYTYVDIVLPGAKGSSSINNADDEYVEILPGTCLAVFEAECHEGIAKSNSSVRLAIWTRSENTIVKSVYQKIVQSNLDNIDKFSK